MTDGRPTQRPADSSAQLIGVMRVQLINDLYWLREGTTTSMNKMKVLYRGTHIDTTFSCESTVEC